MTISSGNGPAADGPFELPPQQAARRFICDDTEWLAWPSGASAYGTGTCGPASLEAVHFARSVEPDKARFEALLPRGRFYGLFDDELVILLRTASAIIEPSERPLKPASRRGVGLL